MAVTPSLTNLTTLQNDVAATAIINANNAAITTAFSEVLALNSSISGNTPNQLGSNLDMNNNQILNLPSPATVNSPVRLVDVAGNPTITVPPVGTSGATVGLLNANNTVSGNTTFSGPTTFSNTITLPNNSVTNAFIRQGVAKSVVGVTGNSTANVADIAGTTRQVLAVSTAGTGLVFAQPLGDQLLGTTTNDNATAGNVGEFVSVTIPSGSAVSLTTNTPASVTSISLTAGDWDVWGCVVLQGTTSTTVSFTAAAVSSTTASIASNAPTVNAYPASLAVFNISGNLGIPVVPLRFSLATTTTVFLNTNVGFAASTCSAYGTISARRIR